MLKSILALNFLDQIVHLKDLEDAALSAALLTYMEKQKVSAMRKSSASRRRFRQRKSWNAFQANLTDRQFRRYFRMSRECFAYLCNMIESNVGEEVFKSEEYLNALRTSNKDEDKVKAQTMNAHDQSTGGFISGEVKLAITLRLLAGDSYLDLSLLYETGPSYAYDIFHDVVENWILDDRLIKINGIKYVSDEDRLEKVALHFARHSKGLLSGCIGAIDGWIVKIKKPTLRDGITNPGSFFSRKGYFGLNVVAIVDKQKRVLYRVIRSRGAEHDSTAFKNSSLYKWLTSNWRWLKDRGFYFIGDSAYSLKSFLVTPFDGVMHGTPEDDFNFFHSSSRISVECAFGEIDLRWGILWRPLGFNMKHNINTIDACLRLHNFIVDYREKHGVTSTNTAMDRDVFDEDCRRFMASQANVGRVGVDGGELELRRDPNGMVSVGGRPTNLDLETTREGKSLRQKIRDHVQ